MPTGGVRGKSRVLMSAWTTPTRMLLGATFVLPVFLGSPTASAQQAQSQGFGDVAFSTVARFGSVSVGSQPHGKSGAMRGSGLEARFMMPIGWGAYYRAITAATDNRDGFEWKHFEIGAGFSRRILRGGTANLLGVRYQLHIDIGMFYAQLGTHETCTTGMVPFAASCDSLSAKRAPDAHGVSLGLEARIAAEVGLGPIGFGVDLGAGAFRGILTGGNSLDPPTWYLVPSAQVKLGLVYAFD